MEKMQSSVGRRKEAIARVFITKGKGEIIINNQDYKHYFPLSYLQYQVEEPLKTINHISAYKITVTAKSGGKKGQAEAIKLGIARSLCVLNPDFKPLLKNGGLLTRDPRAVERKKPGRKKARRRFQFVKR